MDTVQIKLPITVVEIRFPEFVVRLHNTDDSVAEQGRKLMALEAHVRKLTGLPWEVYLETTEDGNKPRQEVAERVREWRQRRLEVGEANASIIL